MGISEGDTIDQDSNETEENSEAEMIWQKIFEAIPTGVCMVNVIVALNQLSMEFAQQLCASDCEDGEDDDISPVGNLPGTSFSKN